LRNLLGSGFNLAGDLQHQLLEILEQKSGFLNVLFHHWRVIQSAEGARQTQSIKAA